MPSDSTIHALAGAAGGIVAMTVTYPLIFLSTRAAVETKNEQKTTYEAVKDVIKREGVLGLYGGLGSSLWGIAITNGVYYYFYERTRGIVLTSRGGSKGLSTLESMITGLVAGSATSIISNPIWVVQTTQAVQGVGGPTDPSSSTSTPRPIEKLSILQTIQHILATDGLPGFMRGVGPALALVINPVIQYTVFEQLKNTLVTRRTAALRAAGGVAVTTAVLTDLDFFLLGALSKFIATGSTYPYIVVKSRLQAGHAKYKSALSGVLSIIKNEGVGGLYKGVANKLLQSVLTAAILFLGQKKIYEVVKKAMTTVPLRKVPLKN